jgi:hypothetical protein
MNAKQRRAKRRIKYFSLLKSLDGSLYQTDMVIHKNDWVLCQFVSDIKKQAYTIKIGTCIANLKSELFDMACDSIGGIPWFGIDQNDLDRLKIRSKELREDLSSYPEIYEYLEYRETEKIAKSAILLECNIFLPYIRELDVKNIIELFKFNNEQTYRDKNPLSPEHFRNDLK